MGTISKNPKSYRLGFRVTEDEYEKILADMKTANYLNTSKYLRACVLNKRIRLERIKDRDTVICGSINEVSKKLSKIGINYNQVVKALNTALKYKDRYGTPCINPIFVESKLAVLIDLTMKIHNEHTKLIQNAAKKNPQNGNSDKIQHSPQLIRINGKLFKDAELKPVRQQGKVRQLLSFRVAVNDVIDNYEYTTYYEVESEMTNLVDELKKNYAVTVLGELHLKPHTDQNGGVTSKLYISAVNIKCHGRVHNPVIKQARPNIQDGQNGSLIDFHFEELKQ